MVARLKKYFFPVFLLCVFLISGCGDVFRHDFTGLFGSTELDTRWKARNTFNFLSADDRNITLGETYSFIVVSDTHINNGKAWGLEKLKDVIESDSDIKFAVFTGDISQDGERENIEKFIQIAGTLDVPCYPVIGNHDLYFGNWKVWEELIGSTCYRINCTSATLLILDSANSYFGAKQLDWLEDELKETEGRVFVFSHVNLFAGSPVELINLMDMRERGRFISLLKGRCDLIFTGHSHFRNITEIGGIININIEDFWHNSVYCQVWVTKDGIRYEFKKL
jgi:3',5'-cyclic AMP phosphodiesterase CpdA